MLIETQEVVTSVDAVSGNHSPFSVTVLLRIKCLLIGLWILLWHVWFVSLDEYLLKHKCIVSWSRIWSLRPTWKGHGLEKGRLHCARFHSACVLLNSSRSDCFYSLRSPTIRSRLVLLSFTSARSQWLCMMTYLHAHFLFSIFYFLLWRNIEQISFLFSWDENVCKHNMKISKVFYIAGALVLLANISPTSGFPRNNRERLSARNDARMIEDSFLPEGKGNMNEWLLQKWQI